MNVKRKCPECQSQRSSKNKNDKPLSYDTDTKLFLCHHCGWKGKDAPNMDEFNSKPKVYIKPKYYPMPVATESERMLAFFAKRGIPVDVIRRNQIEVRNVWMPQTEQEERAICFPYYKDKEIVNVKYRTAEKHFRMESGAELVLYGLDDIDVTLPLIFVEGEMDKLSVEVAGYTNCVSVPNGAGTNLDILAKLEAILEQVPSFIVAGDNDAPGLKLQAELIRRLGAEKCYRVAYPDDCKDINEVLMKYDVEKVKEVIFNPVRVPLEGVFQVADVLDDMIQLYRNGRPKGEWVGWDNLADHYKPRLGTWTVLTGSPNSGKSPFLRALMVNLAVYAGWKFLVFPPEDSPPDLFYSYLTELYTGKPFDEGKTERMTEMEMIQAAEWVHSRFIVMSPAQSKRSLDELLKLTKSAILRFGITSIAIDPYNRLEHFMPSGMNQEQYIGQVLGQFDSFIKQNKLHGFFVAHPTKLKKEVEGKYPVPTMYDIAGAAHWFNMPDFGISVWRDKSVDGSPLEVHVQKVKNHWCGSLGMAALYFDKPTGRFSPKEGYFNSVNTDSGIDTEVIQ